MVSIRRGIPVPRCAINENETRIFFTFIFQKKKNRINSHLIPVFEKNEKTEQTNKQANKRSFVTFFFKKIFFSRDATKKKIVNLV